MSGIVVEDFVVTQSNRRSFLRGLASFAGAVSAQTAYAQHVHPAPADAAGSLTPTALQHIGE